MGLFSSIFKKTETAPASISFNPHIYNNKNNLKKLVKTIEQTTPLIKDPKPNFKGEVLRDMLMFPKDLGEAHVIDMQEIEDIIKSMGVINAIVDKFIDFALGPGIRLVSDNAKAQKIIEDFVQDSNLNDHMRPWLKDALSKGLGVLELGGKKAEKIQGVKVIDSKWCYITRDSKGRLEKVTQIKLNGRNKIINNSSAMMRISKDDVIEFKPWEVALLPFNKVGDSPYGYGIIHPSLTLINEYIGCSKESLMLLKRKANVPIHVKLGMAGRTLSESIVPKDGEIDAFGQKLEWLDNKHEWVTNPFVDMKTIDFGNIGEKFSWMLEHKENMLYKSFQVPAVLMGAGNIAEGLAKVQMEAFERRILSIQSEVEKVLENQIFTRVLQSQGITAHVEVVWGEESNERKLERAKLMVEVMKLPFINPALLSDAEKEFSQLMGLETKNLTTPAQQKKKEKEEPQPRIPGSNRSENFMQEKIFIGELLEDG